MKNCKILYRPGYFDFSGFEDQELGAAQKYFNVNYVRTDCQNCFVIPRYSSLPHYEEFVCDLRNLGCKPINWGSQFSWIVNLMWVSLLKDDTPKTWHEREFYQAPEGQYVVKGERTSKKFNWNKEMFARNKREANEIATKLNNDYYICDQNIYFREYIPLETFEYGINDLPFTNEFRFFFYKTHLIDYGYYWSIAENKPTKVEVGMVDYARRLAKKVAEYVNFFVLDIAKTQKGDYILIEVNDGTMSGLSDINPDSFYKNFSNILTYEEI